MSDSFVGPAKNMTVMAFYNKYALVYTHPTPSILITCLPIWA